MMEKLDKKSLKKSIKENALEFKLFKTTPTDVSIMLQLPYSKTGESEVTLASIFNEHKVDDAKDVIGVSNRSNMKKVLDKLLRYRLIIKTGNTDDKLVYSLTKRGNRYLKCLELIKKLNDNDKGKQKEINVEYHAGGKRIHEFETERQFQDHFNEARNIAYGENFYLVKHENGSTEVHTMKELKKQGIDDISVLIN